MRLALRLPTPQEVYGRRLARALREWFLPGLELRAFLGRDRPDPNG